MSEQEVTYVKLRVRPIEEEAMALAGVMLSTFEEWLQEQPDNAAALADYQTVLTTLDSEEAPAPCQAAALAAVRLAHVASHAPYAHWLVGLFDTLAESWMLDGLAWSERRGDEDE